MDTYWILKPFTIRLYLSIRSSALGTTELVSSALTEKLGRPRLVSLQPASIGGDMLLSSRPARRRGHFPAGEEAALVWLVPRALDLQQCRPFNSSLSRSDHFCRFETWSSVRSICSSAPNYI